MYITPSSYIEKWFLLKGPICIGVIFSVTRSYNRQGPLGIKGPFSLSVSLSGLLLPSFFLASKRFGKGKVTHARHLYCLCRIKCFFVLWLLTCKCHKEEKPWPLPVRYYDGQFIPMINLQTTSVSTLLSELVMFCFSEFSIQAQYSSERHHSSETRSTRQNPILL